MFFMQAFYLLTINECSSTMLAHRKLRETDAKLLFPNYDRYIVELEHLSTYAGGKFSWRQSYESYHRPFSQSVRAEAGF